MLCIFFILRALRARPGPPRARLGPGPGRGGRRNALAGDVVDIILTFLHAVHILLAADMFFAGLGGVAAHELRDLGPVRGESSWMFCVCIFQCFSFL